MSVPVRIDRYYLAIKGHGSFNDGAIACMALADAEVAAAVDAVRADLEAAFSGDEYEENAASAAGEGEWSWFRWLALSTLDGSS
jgi:hypothetical protein